MNLIARYSLPCLLSALTTIFYSCSSNSTDSQFSTDTVSIARGKTMFVQNCSGCHNFKQDGIGPNLNGITRQVTPEWLISFIRDPKKSIESGDERATGLYNRYHTIMPSFTAFTDDNLKDLLAYLHTINEKTATLPADSNYVRNPIPEKIQLSDIVVNIKEIVQIPSSSPEIPRTRIAKLDFHPSSKKIFVLDIRGKLYAVEQNQAKEYMNMPALRKSFIDKPGLATGFGSFAFHPEFAKNGLLYTSHTEPKGSVKADFSYHDSIPVQLQWVLTEWKTANPAAAAFQGQGRELFRINMVTGIHGMQEVTFNPLSKPGDKDYGLLYIGIGDGGCVENNYAFLAHNTARPWGAILRIDPKGNNSKNGRYGIPGDNPFANQNDKLKEIYAYGFRNPHRITWSSSGQMIASNIGQAHIESVNIILAGHDYGWPLREGKFLVRPQGDLTKVFDVPADDSNYHFDYPAAAYDHDEGTAISGGFEYTGDRIPGLKGKYLFGDIGTGRLFYVDMKELLPGKMSPVKEWQVSLNGKTTAVKDLCANDRADLRLGRDASGDIYIFTKIDGKVYRLENMVQK